MPKKIRLGIIGGGGDSLIWRTMGYPVYVWVRANTFPDFLCTS